MSSQQSHACFEYESLTITTTAMNMVFFSGLVENFHVSSCLFDLTLGFDFSICKKCALVAYLIALHTFCIHSKHPLRCWISSVIVLMGISRVCVCMRRIIHTNNLHVRMVVSYVHSMFILLRIGQNRTT